MGSLDGLLFSLGADPHSLGPQITNVGNPEMGDIDCALKLGIGQHIVP